jgi:hypothetical protein
VAIGTDCIGSDIAFAIELLPDYGSCIAKAKAVYFHFGLKTVLLLNKSLY